MNGPAHSHADMRNRNPALQGVVAGSMEDIGHTDGSRRPGNFDAHEEGPVIDDAVSQQHFMVPLVTHETGGGVIQHAGAADSAEEAEVFGIPKLVGLRRDLRAGRRLGFDGRGRGCRRINLRRYSQGKGHERRQ